VDEASIDETRRKAGTLRALHAAPRLLVLPNAWDAASGRAFEAAGFAAIATTSGGVANALGYEDHERAPVEEMLAAAQRIVRSVSVPVTVDLEAGYGLEPGEIVKRLVAIGAAGFNFEDSNHHGNAELIPAEVQVERIAALKAAARAAGIDLVLNARVDVFLSNRTNPEAHLADGLHRARLYRHAGADCIYPITLGDKDMISEFVKTVDVVNVNVRRGGPLTLTELSGLGVRRISYATSIFRESLATVERAAASIQDESKDSVP
jgi:2-methylisocitrate lyase-like PEP mutase family enzyme